MLLILLYNVHRDDWNRRRTEIHVSTRITWVEIVKLFHDSI